MLITSPPPPQLREELDQSVSLLGQRHPHSETQPLSLLPEPEGS